MLIWHCEEGILLCFCTVCTAEVCQDCLSFLFCVFNCLEYGNGKPGKVLSRAQLNVDEVSFPANESQWIQVKAGSAPTRI